MTDHYASGGYRPRHGWARPVVLVATAMLLIAGLVGTDISFRPGRAGAIVVHGWTPPAGPPPASAAVVAAVVAAERQITSLGAYSDARVYLKVARGEAESAAGAYGRSVQEWQAATAKEVRAVAVRAAANETVNLYDEALYELGIAEYTGIAVRDNLDLASQEREVDQAELGDVAATDTATGLKIAKTELALSIRRLNHARVVVAVAKTVVAHKSAQLGTATAQLAASRKALALARQWVLVPGKAPARPVAALTALEGKVALQVKAERLAALALATRPVINATGAAIEGAGTGANTGTATTTSTTTTTTTATTTTTTVPVQAQAAPGVLALIRQAALSGVAASGPSILGPSVLSAGQIEGWFASTGAQANAMVPLIRLIADYMEAGRLTGVRADLAFAQSVVETGYFSFPAGGQLAPKNNNFAGIGACDKCKHGWSFASPMDGIVAQEELLSQYAGLPPAPSLSSIGAGGVDGCCTTWMSLAGVWATNPAYGFEIMSVYREMLDWALLGEEQETGLVPPGPSVGAPAGQPGAGQPSAGQPSAGPPSAGQPSAG